MPCKLAHCNCSRVCLGHYQSFLRHNEAPPPKVTCLPQVWAAFLQMLNAWTTPLCFSGYRKESFVESCSGIDRQTANELIQPKSRTDSGSKCSWKVEKPAAWTAQCDLASLACGYCVDLAACPCPRLLKPRVRAYFALNQRLKSDRDPKGFNNKSKKSQVPTKLFHEHPASPNPKSCKHPELSPLNPWVLEAGMK